MISFLVSFLLLLQPAQANQAASLPAILNDGSIWGKDFSAVLPSLPAWQQTGEQQVIVFSDRIVGNTPYERPEGVRAGVAELGRALAVSRATAKGAVARNLRAEAIPFPEDDSIRVAMITSSLQLLNPQLTRAGLEQTFGPPEKVSSLTLQNKAERRPVVLTLYQYANGTVIFAEPDLTTRPGFVDRVFLNVSALNRAVFPEVRK